MVDHASLKTPEDQNRPIFLAPSRCEEYQIGIFQRDLLDCEEYCLATWALRLLRLDGTNNIICSDEEQSAIQVLLSVTRQQAETLELTELIGQVKRVNWSNIIFDYHKNITDFCMQTLEHDNHNSRVLMLGLGFGAIAGYLLDHTETFVDSIEIDAGVVALTRLLFQTTQHDRHTIYTQDAARFIETSTPNTYSIIIIDVGSHDTVSTQSIHCVAPAPEMMTTRLLARIDEIAQDGCYLIVNILMRDTGSHGSSSRNAALDHIICHITDVLSQWKHIETKASPETQTEIWHQNFVSCFQKRGQFITAT